MGLFRKSRDHPGKKKAVKAAATKGKTQARAWTPGRFKSVTRYRADNTLAGNEAIYAAVSRIANTVASMPVHLTRASEPQTEHPLERLLTLAPNVNQSAFNFFQTMEVCRNVEGNAYALIRRGPLGQATALDVLDPTRVRPQRLAETGELWFWITLDDGKSYPLPGCELIALRHMSANGELGIRPVDVLHGTLEYDRQTKEFSLNQLDGVNQGIFLTLPSTGLGEEERDKVIDDFLDAYERSGQRVVILEGGMQAQTFGQSPVNAQVLEVERIMRNRVATVYNIPPHLLGDYSDTSFATAEQQMQEYLNLTILPIVRQWEEELNRKLLTEADWRAGYRFRFDMSALGRADTAAMANKYQMAIRGGWMRPNEVRAQEGLPQDPDGDTLMASRDLLPLSVAANAKE